MPTPITFQWSQQSLTSGSVTAEGLSSRFPTAVTPSSIPGQVMWDMRCTKWHWRWFSPSSWDYCANSVSETAPYSMIIIELTLIVSIPTVQKLE